MRTIPLLAFSVLVLGCNRGPLPLGVPAPPPQAQADDPVKPGDPPRRDDPVKPAPIRPGVSLENYARLRKGMTLEEVKAILGPPHQSMYLDGDAAWEDPRRGETKHLEDKKRVHWQWSTQYRPLEGLDIVVDFEKGKATSLLEQRSIIDPR